MLIIYVIMYKVVYIMDKDFKDKLINEYTNKRYLSPREIIYREPNKVSIEKLKKFMFKFRKNKGDSISLKDEKNNNFWFMKPVFVEREVHHLEMVSRHELEKIASKELRKNILIEDMLLDEAFYSSVIEGAFSTKKRTKEVIKTNNPKNKSEKMILNNYNAMTYVIENLDKEMNEDILIELHKIVTKETLSEDEAAKKYRKGPVYVNDPNETEPVYIPPSAENVQPLMDDLFQFINDDSNNDKFIKPLIKAFIIHFYICYVHPFYDGNGRVARAFQYMYLLKNNYNFFKFFSISGIISSDRKKYYKSFMDTEKYDNDLTYFIVTQMEMTLKAIKDVIDKMLKEMENKLIKDELSKDNIILNKRQEKFIKYMVQKDNNFTTIADYKKKFKISYETARRDLFELNELNIVKKIKKGKKYIFIYQGVKGYI